MRKLVFSTTAVAAFVVAGIAIAHGVDTKSIKPVSATFTATGASNVRTSTCTAPDGSYTTTRATYTGTAMGDPTLSGPIWISAESVVNTTTGVGIVSGRFEIDTAGRNTEGRLDAVVSAGGIAGLAAGHTQDPHTSLLANVSASFTAAGGFTNGKLGGNTGPGGAVEISPPGCRPTPAPKPEKIEVRGNVTAVSATSISAAGVTCAVPASLQAKVAGLAVGSRVEMRCVVAGGATTLDRISVRDHDRD